MKKLLSLLFLLIMLTSCTAAPAPATEVIPTKTIIPTETSYPTITPPPSSTLLPTPTHTPIPTFTPATPSFDSESYKLQEWAADKADLLIDQISSNLDAIAGKPIFQSVYGWSYYIEQYKFLVLAEKEALLRFTNASQATHWRWDLCYNLALATFYGGSDAPELPCYAQLIEEGLNSGQTDISNLASWFSSHEGRFWFSINSFSPPQGYTSSYIITLADSAIWLLLEKEGKFQAMGLMSDMFYFREAGIKFQLLDLTGDGYPELVLCCKV